MNDVLIKTSLVSPPSRVEKYLKKKYCMKPRQIREMLALSPKLVETPLRTIHENINVLEMITHTEHVRKIVYHTPHILGTSMQIWFDFLTTYGVSKRTFLKLIEDHPEIFLKSNVYEYGNILLDLKEKGCTELEILNVYIPYHPHLFVHN